MKVWLLLKLVALLMVLPYVIILIVEVLGLQKQENI